MAPSGPRPPIPPGIARVALSGTSQGHKWTNVFYLQLTGTGITATDLNSLASTIGSAWATDIANEVPSTTVLSLVEIVYIPSPGNEVIGSSSTSHAGTNAGTLIDNAASCIVMNWNISAYYRGGHPRTYHAGVTTSQVTNGSDVTSSAQSNMANSYGLFRTAVNGATTTNISGVSMGTLSFASGNAWRTTPLFRPYTGVLTRPKLGSQRRRILA